MPEEGSRYKHWVKSRTFVRAIEGKYGEIYRNIYSQPRVLSTKTIPWTGGPMHFGKFIVSPTLTSTPLLTQAIEAHIQVLAPGGYSQKHGHMNSAVAYILEGKGYEIHDGKRLDWQAGDAVVIRNGCVHQHFNASPDKPTKVLIMKSKPLFIFFNLLFQKNLKFPPDKSIQGGKDFEPSD